MRTSFDTTIQKNMPAKAKITAYHGWGFDGSMWDDWLAHLPDGWQLIASDRGYFDSAPYVAPIAKDSHFNILVSHSFGLHCLSVEALQQTDLLVVIAGFEKFHIEQAPASRRAVGRMLRHLATDPLKVLKDFRAACLNNFWHRLNEVEGKLNLEILRRDLMQLDIGSVSFEELNEVSSILLLHGAQDHIVPASAALNLHKYLSVSTVVLHEEAGHALPITNALWCINQIIKTAAEINGRRLGTAVR